MIVHFINPQKSGGFKYYDVLLIENDETLYRLQLGFGFGDDETVLEQEAIRILESLDNTKTITQVIIDIPDSWQF
jgi:hypothetical protein